MALPCVLIGMQHVTAVDEKADSQQHVSCSYMTSFLRLLCTHSVRMYEGEKCIAYVIRACVRCTYSTDISAGVLHEESLKSNQKLFDPLLSVT